MTQISGTTPTTNTLTAAAGTWQLDPTGTSIKLQTKAMWGLAKVKADFKAVGGSAVVSPDASVTGTLVIDAASVTTGNNKRDTHLRSNDFFEVDRYPTFTYTVRSVTVLGADKAHIDGSLTVRDVTRDLPLEGTITEAGPGVVTMVAEVDMNRASWQVNWAKMGAGMDNHIVITARFTKAS